VSCDDILCFESLFTLGESARIVQMRGTTAPWLHLDPHVPSITKFDEPSLEQMLADHIDVAFVYSNARALERYQRAGIAALVSQSPARDSPSAEKFLAGQKENLRLYADVLGRKAMERESRWETYVDTQVRFVTSRTGGLSPQERPKAYYLRGPDALTSHGTRACPYWYSYLAGADMVLGRTSNDGRGAISAEQLILWDPDVVFVGRLYSADLLLNDPRFRTLRAVQRNAVYPMPSGVFFWDGGPESVLLMLWVAKTVHPELFRDLDLAAAVRDYYSQFYGVLLDARSVENLLAGRAADGRRLVTRNN
jgi:iron complex transport system substrate-binding protein